MLALANCGNATRAEAFVKELLARDDLPVVLRSDALALAGRIAKDQAARAADPAARQKFLARALWCYRRADEHSGDTFPAINAATLARLCGDRDLSRKPAAEVRDKLPSTSWTAPARPATTTGCWRRWARPICWPATTPPAEAVTPRPSAWPATPTATATSPPCSASSAPDRDYLPQGDDLPVADLLAQFHLGPVVAFAGHRIDRPGDPTRFPPDPALEAAVRRAIKHELDALEPTIGYCSPACGSEVLFGELMRERGAEMHVVLPYNEKDFTAERLTYGLPEMESWQKRYEELRGVSRSRPHAGNWWRRGSCNRLRTAR